MEIKNLVSVNITAVMIGTHSALRFFKQQGYGKVFNMEGFGSDGRIMDKLGLYGTTKRAVHYFSKAISREVKEQHIQVGILSPGMVRTDFLSNSASDADPVEQERNRKVFEILAEDVEVVTRFLCSRILRSTKKYDRIEFLTMRRLAPKLIRLMFVKHKS
jgi:short-subunit dehydrogenase